MQAIVFKGNRQQTWNLLATARQALLAGFLTRSSRFRAQDRAQQIQGCSARVHGGSTPKYRSASSISD